MQTPSQSLASFAPLIRPHAFQHIKDYFHAQASSFAFHGDYTREAQMAERAKELWYVTADRNPPAGAFSPLVRRAEAPNGEWIARAEFDQGVSK